MRKVWGLACVIVLMVFNVLGQARNPFYHFEEIDIKPDLWLSLHFDFNFTAFSIETEDELTGSLIVKIDNEEIALYPDEHIMDTNLTQLISVNESSTSLEIYSELTTGKIKIHLLNSSTSNLHKYRKKPQERSQEECNEPALIHQAEWRAGLPPPSYTRSFSDVEHVIVHHSAGSNSNTNFEQVVRDIYLYHTQVNGWSDIGYNYLIDQEGTIYAGRDPGDGEQDNVVGAHFCGKNTSTMGICLLGNYETAQPTTASLQSLSNLTAWKMKHEQLDPFGNAIHRGEDLDRLAGHRDGCATLCPGENLYTRLNEIRIDVQLEIDICEESDNAEQLVSVHPNPVETDQKLTVQISDKDRIQAISIIDPQGKHVLSRTFTYVTNKVNLSTTDYSAGLYALKIQTAADSLYQYKVVIY